MSARIEGVSIVLAVALAASCAMADNVAKIGSVEYETLQDALDAAAGQNCTITLLYDIDVTTQLDLPAGGGYSNVVTLDGGGHTIRQAAATRIFHSPEAYTFLVLTNITVLGGGEACSTANDTVKGVGTVYSTSGNSGNFRITFDAGTIVSNFYTRGPMFDLAQSAAVVNDGALITCNRASDADAYMGCVFRVTSGSVTMNGGEISANAGNYGTVVLIRNAAGRFTMNGGAIKSNDCFRSGINGGVINAYSGGTVTINDGLIAENFCSAAGTTYTASNLKTTGVVFPNSNAVFNFNGGKIIGNDGIGVYVRNGYAVVARLSGDGIIAANAGPSFCRHDTDVAIALVGDFNGFVEVYTAKSSSNTSTDGAWIVATNAAEYAGAWNIHAYGFPFRIGVQEDGTKNIWLRNQNEAKIGGTEYDTLDRAFSSASNGATIELLRDIARNGKTQLPTPPAKTLTIDGCGHRLYRSAGTNMLDFATAGANLTLTNVALWGGCSTSYSVYTNGDFRGNAALLRDGVAATLTLAGDVTFEDFCGTNALLAVGEGGTLNLFGAAVTNMSNKAVDATGGTVGLKGETFVHDNANGDLDVANGGILSLCGDLLGKVHVTVAGAEAYDGQMFGTTTGAWGGLENFVNGGEDKKLHVSGSDGRLAWFKRGFIMMVQ